MTPDEFDAGMAVLFSVWPKEASSLATLAVYAEIVRHLPGDVWRAAALLHLTRSPYFPKPHELLDCAAELTTPPQRTGLEAWNDVQQAIITHGVYHPPNGAQYGEFKNYEWDFSDPLVSRLIDGAKAWAELCMSENQTADRARFIDAYEKVQQRAREQARLTPALVQLQSEQRTAALALVGDVAERLTRR